MTFLLGLLKPVALKIMAGLAIAGAALALYYSVRQSGRLAERADNLKKASKVKDDQLRAAADRPNSDDALDRRLRDGRF